MHILNQLTANKCLSTNARLCWCLRRQKQRTTGWLDKWIILIMLQMHIACEWISCGQVAKEEWNATGKMMVGHNSYVKWQTKMWQQQIKTNEQMSRNLSTNGLNHIWKSIIWVNRRIWVLDSCYQKDVSKLNKRTNEQVNEWPLNNWFTWLIDRVHG